MYSPPLALSGLCRASTLSVGLPPVAAREPRVSARGKPTVSTRHLRRRLVVVPLLPGQRRHGKAQRNQGGPGLHLLRSRLMTPTRFRLDEGFEYGDAATTSRRSLAARRAVDAGKWRPAAPKAPRQRNAAPEYIVVSKQLLESKPTVPTVKRAPPRTSGESFADDDLTHTSSVTGHSRQSYRPLTSPVQTWRLRDRTPPATALMPRWAAKERRAATTSGGRPKGGKAADDDVPESLAYLPARLPTDRYFDAASRLEDPTSPYYWTGQLSSPAARVFLTPNILHVGRRHALRRTTINARSRIY